MQPQTRVTAFAQELQTLQQKYGIDMMLTAELRPASTDGTLGIVPKLVFTPVADWLPTKLASESTRPESESQDPE